MKLPFSIVSSLFPEFAFLLTVLVQAVLQCVSDERLCARPLAVSFLEPPSFSQSNTRSLQLGPPTDGSSRRPWKIRLSNVLNHCWAFRLIQHHLIWFFPRKPFTHFSRHSATLPFTITAGWDTSTNRSSYSLFPGRLRRLGHFSRSYAAGWLSNRHLSQTGKNVNWLNFHLPPHSIF